MRVKVHYIIVGLGDGTPVERRFKSPEERERYLQAGFLAKSNESGHKFTVHKQGVYIFDTEGYEVVK